MGWSGWMARPTVSLRKPIRHHQQSRPLPLRSDPGDDEVYLDDDGVYGIGDKIEVTVTFSENVTVIGSPQLELTVGSSAKNAAYKSATDSKVVFSSTVAVGDSDTDGISIAANKLSLNEGTIKDAAENDADLSHSAVSDPVWTQDRWDSSDYNERLLHW